MELLEVLVEAVPAFHKSSANTADRPLPRFQANFQKQISFYSFNLAKSVARLLFSCLDFNLQYEICWNEIYKWWLRLKEWKFLHFYTLIKGATVGACNKNSIKKYSGI